MTQPEQPRTSGRAAGLALFAAVIMIMIGGYSRPSQPLCDHQRQVHVIIANHAYEPDVTDWGWIHLILGMVVALSGFYVLSGRLWARIIGITLALDAIANFFFIPYYPAWSVLIIALDVFVIWHSRPTAANESSTDGVTPLHADEAGRRRHGGRPPAAARRSCKTVNGLLTRNGSWRRALAGGSFHRPGRRAAGSPKMTGKPIRRQREGTTPAQGMPTRIRRAVSDGESVR